jgi:hypothetical protein
MGVAYVAILVMVYIVESLYCQAMASEEKTKG